MSAFEPSDGIAETVERQLQVAVAGATVSARVIVARRQQALREAQSKSEESARALRARQNEERELAAARLSPVFDDGWWETATPQDVASMWHDASSWTSSPEELAADAVAPAPTIFDRAAGRITQEVHERSGLDVADVAALAELQHLERAHHAAELGSDVAAADRPSGRAEDRRTPAAENPGRAPGAAAAPAGGPRERSVAGFDDPARREQLREQLEQAGVPEQAIQARVLADIGQGSEAANATHNADAAVSAVRSPARTAAPPRHRHR